MKKYNNCKKKLMREQYDKNIPNIENNDRNFVSIYYAYFLWKYIVNT